MEWNETNEKNKNYHAMPMSENQQSVSRYVLKSRAEAMVGLKLKN
jgi:hypothetical protein